MSFPRYERYKDSGVDWLGEVPHHWRSTKLKWLSRRYSGGTPDKTRPEYWEHGNIPWLSSGEVNQSLIVNPSAFITEEAFANSSAKWIPAGALVVALAGQGKTKGTVAQVSFRATCNQSMAAIIPHDESQAKSDHSEIGQWRVEQYHRSGGSSQERDWKDTHPPDCFGRSAVLTQMLLEMAPPEPARLLRELRCARWGHWLAVHILL
jgi:restriction endonuclease S subunit